MSGGRAAYVGVCGRRVCLTSALPVTFFSTLNAQGFPEGQVGPFLTALRHPEMPASWLQALWHLDSGARAPLLSKAAVLFLLGLCGRPHTRPFELQGCVLAKAGVFGEEERKQKAGTSPKLQAKCSSLIT